MVTASKSPFKLCWLRNNPRPFRHLGNSHSPPFSPNLIHSRSFKPQTCVHKWALLFRCNCTNQHQQQLQQQRPCLGVAQLRRTEVGVGACVCVRACAHVWLCVCVSVVCAGEVEIVFSKVSYLGLRISFKFGQLKNVSSRWSTDEASNNNLQQLVIVIKLFEALHEK